jgi:hypothetical protein
VARIAPLPARLYDDDLGGHDLPEPRRAQGQDSLAPQQPATGGARLDREHDKLEGRRQIDVGRRRLVLALPSRRGNLGRDRFKAEPLAVSGHVAAAGFRLGKHDIGGRHDVLRAIGPPA